MQQRVECSSQVINDETGDSTIDDFRQLPRRMANWRAIGHSLDPLAEGFRQSTKQKCPGRLGTYLLHHDLPRNSAWGAPRQGITSSK
jgi:hypothetical protein